MMGRNFHENKTKKEDLPLNYYLYSRTVQLTGIIRSLQRSPPPSPVKEEIQSLPKCRYRVSAGYSDTNGTSISYLSLRLRDHYGIEDKKTTQARSLGTMGLNGVFWSPGHNKITSL